MSREQPRVDRSLTSSGCKLLDLRPPARSTPQGSPRRPLPVPASASLCSAPFNSHFAPVLRSSASQEGCQEEYQMTGTLSPCAHLRPSRSFAKSVPRFMRRPVENGTRVDSKCQQSCTQPSDQPAPPSSLMTKPEYSKRSGAEVLVR